MKINSELKSLQHLWKSSEARAQTDNVPDASYQVRIAEHKLERSKAKQRMQVKCVLRILTGPYKNRPIYKYSQLETENNMSWFKGDMQRLGVKIPKNLLHLPELLEETVDMILGVTVKTNGAFTNIYFNEVIEELPDDDDDDMEDDEEEEKPKKKKKKKKAKKAKAVKPEEEYEEDDDDDELDDEDEDEDDEEEDEEDEE